MLIIGLQKLTLLDFPGKVACTVFTGGCGFRCPFCHNASLVTGVVAGNAIKADEIFSFLKKRSGILEGVAITGGEPTIQKDLPEFMRTVKEMGYAVKLDTNGDNPDMLEDILSKGLADYVAMDIKSSPERYGYVAGVKNFDIAPVTRSKDLLLHAGIPYEFRTTVVRELHRPEDFDGIGQFINGADKYFIQSFKDSGDILGGEFSAWDKDTLINMLDRVKPHVKEASLRGID